MIRLLASDIFRLKFVKNNHEVIICTYSILRVLQIYFFFSSPSLTKLMNCGGAFFQLSKSTTCRF
jgi:hypothetical protein